MLHHCRTRVVLVALLSSLEPQLGILPLQACGLQEGIFSVSWAVRMLL